MVRYCYDVLHNHFDPSHEISAPLFANSSQPMFVTLLKNPRKKSGCQHQPCRSERDESELRGCIGTFSAVALHEGLHKYVKQSAFKDRRFDPLEAEEIPALTIAVSLLTHFEDADGYLDWDVGVHGVSIDFHVEGRDYHATFLPEVALEQGWSQMKTIENLVRKAGYKEKVTGKVLESITLTRYQSSKTLLCHQSYLNLKKALK